MTQRPPVLGYGHQRPSDKLFPLVGFAVGLLCAVLLNAVPYLMTRGAYSTDDHETAGFPLSFYRCGGFLGRCEVYVAAIVIDAAVCLAVAVVGGFMGILLSRRSGRRSSTSGTDKDRYT